MKRKSGLSYFVKQERPAERQVKNRASEDAMDKQETNHETQVGLNRPETLIAGNTNTGLLKCVALVFMIIDHVGAALLPGLMELRLLGRIAFPLYAWCIAVGCEYTRNLWKYALRLLIAGIISQPCFMLGLNHGIMEWNVFATLLLGQVALAGIKEKKYGSQILLPAAAFLLSLIVKMDYGWKGILLILLFYACRDKRAAIFAMFLPFCMLWGQGTSPVSSMLGLRIPLNISFLPQSANLLGTILKIQFFAILALPFILYPSRKQLRLPKIVSYGVYPLHLLLLGLIRLALH